MEHITNYSLRAVRELFDKLESWDETDLSDISHRVQCTDNTVDRIERTVDQTELTLEALGIKVQKLDEKMDQILEVLLTQKKGTKT